MAKSIADIVCFATDPAEVSTERPAPEKVVSGDPIQTVRNYYTDPSGRFSAGIWEGEPGRVRVVYTEEEFCLLLEGEVILTDGLGEQRRFTAGDAFVIPAGFVGTWETVVRARKYYVILEAAQQ
jgi:uncharacterized cupin superfamily protein